MSSLVDVDCNLFHEDLQKFCFHENGESNDIFTILDQDAVVESNVRAILAPSSTLQEAERYLPLIAHRSSLNKSNKAPRVSSEIQIRSTVGVHPYHVDDEDLQGGPTPQHLHRMRQLLSLNTDHCAAIGECGLDASEGFPPLEHQLPWFEAQVRLAEELRFPLFVHERLAFERTMQTLELCTVPVIIHCFTGTVEQCKAYIERGYYLSLSGYIFKQDAVHVRDCLTSGLIPLDKLMIETDAPYMGFNGCRDSFLSKQSVHVDGLNSKRRKRLVNSIYPNVPSSLPFILDNIVELINEGKSNRGVQLVSREELARCTSEAAASFFKFKQLGVK